jgi:hypothetical protein
VSADINREVAFRQYLLYVIELAGAEFCVYFRMIPAGKFKFWNPRNAHAFDSVPIRDGLALESEQGKQTFDIHARGFLFEVIRPLGRRMAGNHGGQNARPK